MLAIILGLPHASNASIQPFSYFVMLSLPLKLFGSLGQIVLLGL
jgi:hypothetical protein